MGTKRWCLFEGEKTKQLERSSLGGRRFEWKISSVASQPTLDSLCALIDSMFALIWWLVAAQNMKDSTELNQT